jgi:fatty acid CoA ligase FadD9
MNPEQPQPWRDDVSARALERCRSLLANDPDLQRSAPSPAALERIQAEGLSSFQRFALTCELYAERPCLGERGWSVEDGKPRALPEFRHISYAQLWARVAAFASGLKRLGLGEPGTLLGISGFPNIDGVVADLACVYLAAVSVPLSTTAPAHELAHILAGAGVPCVACGVAHLEVVSAALGSAPGVRALVVTGVGERERADKEGLAVSLERIRQEHPGVSIHRMDEVERLGRDAGPVPPVERVGDDALRALVYTSGSTGTPKGAMFPERVLSLEWQRGFDVGFPEVPRVAVNYMPLNHMAGRLVVLGSLTYGGLTSFVGASDMSTLFEDIRIARPTMLMVIPRVANMMYQRFTTEVMRRAAGSRDAEAEVMEEMRGSVLGDRLLYMMTGAAPTAADVRAFLTRCFDVPVLDGYGSTEAGVVAIEGRMIRDNVTDYVLADVPELGYGSRDRPYPRGELRVKTRQMVPGYYGSPEATRDLFDDAGFLCTGDVVEQRGPDEIAYIDRKKNVLKLSQGEFVSISPLEELYSAGSPFIGQVYLQGSSLWSYLLGVIVPQGTADKALLRREIDRIAAREGLNGYEIPRDFLVDPAPFTQANGLLTDSGKLSRPRLRARYGEHLERLHADIERRQIEELRALESARDVSAVEKVVRAFAVTLGLPEREVRDADQSFQKLGGDSIAAVELVTRVRDLVGIDLPVAQVLDPTSSLSALMRVAEQRLSAADLARRVTFADVHGAGAEILRAEDLRIDRFIPSSELAAAGSARLSGPPVVVLTGANGFLGRFLLLELVERVALSGGRVVAMVRARDDGAARERLAAAYTRADPKLPVGSADPRLAARFAELSADSGRLEVVAGDLMKSRFGLPQERWERLADEVSAVVHPGALVNHAFSYPELFEPNVLGTVEVMRLALRRRAPIGFVSTAGVAVGLDRVEPIREDEDAAALWQRRPIDSGYAVGYSTTKWAGELLMRDLVAQCAVPVSVFRPTMIMPPRSFAGEINADDLLTRLLQSIVVTGVAPRSFYTEAAPRRHFDGLPVDTVARDIAALALATREGYATYHVANGHFDDGFSLDTFVGWIQRAGYPVKRIDDYPAWLRTFRQRLEALPAAEQRRSALAGLKLWERAIDREPAFDNRRLRDRLDALGESAVMPHVEEPTIRRYLENMISAGLIGRPERELSANP